MKGRSTTSTPASLHLKELNFAPSSEILQSNFSKVNPSLQLPTLFCQTDSKTVPEKSLSSMPVEQFTGNQELCGVGSVMGASHFPHFCAHLAGGVLRQTDLAGVSMVTTLG